MVAFLNTLRRVSGVFCLCGFMTACGSPAKYSHKSSATELPAVTGEPDFNWRLSGDRRVAPKQVFSDLDRVWLQWPHTQPLPTIFGRVDDVWEVLQPQKVGAYVLISGEWTALKFQGGAVKALAQKIGYESIPQQVLRYDSRHNQYSTQHDLDHEQPRQLNRQPGLAYPSQSAQLIQQPRPVFSIQPSDKTIRQAIKRWASLTTWHFDNVHWAVNVDLPITASAEFSDDFVTSVQQLLTSTEMSDKPVQPCFYTNKVLRVVPIAQACDPQARKESRA